MPVDEFGREIPGAAHHHRERSAAALDAPLHASRGKSSSDHPRREAPPGSSRSGGGGGRGGGGGGDHNSSSSRPSHGGGGSSISPRHQQRHHPPSRHHSHIKKNHPSFQYTEEPLQCQFVWKDSTNNSSSGSGKKTRKKKDKRQPSSDIDTDDEDTSAAAGAAAAQGNDDDNDSSSDTDGYDAYRRQYCLNYIRSFFNKHLDDSWFRVRYSPAVRRQAILQERDRAVQEATRIRDAAREHTAAFLESVSLGGGDKKNTASTVTPVQHLFAVQQQCLVPTPPTTTNASSQQPQAALHIQEIPPHVTDEQLLLALQDHATAAAAAASSESSSSTPATTTKLSSSDWHVWPTSTISTENLTALQREALVVGPAAAVAELWQTLQKQEPQPQSGTTTTTTTSSSNAGGGTSAAVPRKEQQESTNTNTTPTPNIIHSNKPVILDVECSDHYGRLEYDADGRGGAPADGLSVPVRKSVVTVTRLAPHNAQSLSKKSKNVTLTLSAALSSTQRLENDKEAAITMAQALDKTKGIAEGVCLQDILQPDWSAADMLDVAIAYLRRVHLVSFYNGCATAETVADVLLGKSAVSTIHLRLSNADELLEPSNDEEENSKDLLVQRLDDSIAKALEECEAKSSTTLSATLVDDQTERDAEVIAAAEDDVKEKWLDDHAITDADGRARCSFRFCHKLFKDTSYLNKHLLKKHAEFLRAEQAKCHDEYMMKAWDDCEDRPVPDVMVDCGALLGCVAVKVHGKVPDCVDPEPELWRRQEEYRQRENEMKARRDELRQQQYQQQQRQQREQDHAPPPPPRAAFVDVDDMKEEKVELSFENVEVPDATAVPKKKKKKKRKLL